MSGLRARIKALLPRDRWPGLYRLAQTLRARRNAWRRQRDRRRLAARRAALHARLLHEKRGRAQLRVVFVAMTPSTWKVDPVFRAMLADPAFSPVVAIVPRITQDPALTEREMAAAHAHFTAAGYPTVMSRGAAVEGRRVIDDLAPDLVFMANPHRLTLPEFYEDIYDSHLCCYVPYQHQIGRYDNHAPEYDQPFHNAMWRIFLPHEISLALAREHSASKGANSIVTGYPACEDLRDDGRGGGRPGRDAWKPRDGRRLRLIWAPHHTIDMPNLPYANFLRYAEDFRQEVERRRDDVQWAFKPHPLLLDKLHRHPDWGPERAEEYYRFWRDHPCCQLETGEYVDLFLGSDAMIHDSGSFLAEYLYVDKPVLFLQAVDDIEDFFNDYGIAAFHACAHARGFADVARFIDGVLAGDDDGDGDGGGDDGAAARRAFLRRHVDPWFETPPSARIIAEIRRHFPGLPGGL